MLHERTTTAFFYLLQAGLWEHEISVPDIFPLQELEWEIIYKQSVQQTVEGIIYDGIQHLQSSERPPRQLLLKWLIRIEHIERRNKAMNKAISDQITFFTSFQITPILLKGQGIAQYYRNPLHRICGDIDWYFPTKDMYQKANQLIQKKGLKMIFTAGYSSSYLWDKFDIEHHQDLFDIHNPFCTSFLKKLEKREQVNKIYKSLHDACVEIPAALINILQINSHILKHLLSYGIGIRQLCDSATLYYKLQNEIDPIVLKEIYSKLGIDKWIDQLHHILVRYVGLPKQYIPYPLSDRPADWMMHDILLSGNFGFHDHRYQQAELQNNGNRVQARSRLWHSFKTYLPYAPMEAISFPIVQFISRFSR